MQIYVIYFMEWFILQSSINCSTESFTAALRPIWMSMYSATSINNNIFTEISYNKGNETRVNTSRRNRKALLENESPSVKYFEIARASSFLAQHFRMEMGIMKSQPQHNGVAFRVIMEMKLHITWMRNKHHLQQGVP